jgi:c-di-GMP-binding flagellar brake protein YcgR
MLTLPNAAPLEGRCIDISASGMGLVTELNLRAGTVCQLAFVIRFSDESTYAAEVSAKVAYCVFSNDTNGFKVGAQFSEVSARTNAAFQRFLKG